MSAAPDPLEWLLRPSGNAGGIDRKTLAGLLLDVARIMKPELAAEQPAVAPVDVRLEQLRALLLGREIETLARLREVIEDSEQFAQAVGRILPNAFAQASGDGRLGHVLAPTLEKAAAASIRNDPRTLMNILYPLIVPAIRKSIGEVIDKTFESLNLSLKYSLTWRGLRWRWEAWRTGVSFAEVVLRHTLVYQVEHAFLIHSHTGLLIAHVASEHAESQDPQLVSSMLTAIQDFVRDSFSGAENQGVDTLRLGELTLWSEPGPFASLVAVIRGNPPEELHATMADTLSRIHAERHQALEAFDGDSSALADVEAELHNCVALKQEAPSGGLGFPVLGFAIAMSLLLFAGVWMVRGWQDNRRLEHFVAALRSQPGLVITEAAWRHGKFAVVGLRDPLAMDPALALNEAGIDPSRVNAYWAPYEALDSSIVLKRLEASLTPPSGVQLAIDGDRIVASGMAPSSWLDRARLAGRMLPAGAPAFDVSGVQNADAAAQWRWDVYVAQLRAEPGIVVTEIGRRDGKYTIAGLRDPLAVDPEQALADAGIDPSQVVAHWAPYQAIDPATVLKRLQVDLKPPTSVRFIVDGDRIVAQGGAPALWLERARLAGRILPAGAPVFDVSGLQTLSDGEIDKLRVAIQSRNIRFDANEALPAPGQDTLLNDLATELKALTELSTTLHVSTHVMLTGHADSVGQGTLNLSLSLARAEVVRAMLKKRGVDPDLLAVRGAGALEPLNDASSDAARSANRRVSFTVGIENQP